MLSNNILCVTFIALECFIQEVSLIFKDDYFCYGT